jgi:hypothetical protein
LLKTFMREKHALRPIQWLAVAASTAVLGDCQGSPPLQAIDVPAISAVQSEINRQVGIYLAASHQPIMINVGGQLMPIKNVRPPDGGRMFACGTGNVAFEISQIKAELTTTSSKTIGGSAGITVPIHMVTIGAKAGDTVTATNTQTLSYQVWSVDKVSQNPNISNLHPSREYVDKTPIAQVLRDLREALVAAGTTYDYSQTPPVKRQPLPCFTDYDPKKPATASGNTYTLGLSIVNDITGGVTVSVAVLNLGITGEAKSTTGNTLTVSFSQPGIESIQIAQDAVDTECKYPKQDTAACIKAKNVRSDAIKSNDSGTLNVR